MDMQSITFPGLDGIYGVAPSGYGLGKSTNQLQRISTPEQADQLLKAGLYEYYSDVVCCGYPGTQYGSILVVPSMWSTTQFFFTRLVGKGCYLKRINTSDGDDWQPWEWVNPPMQQGVEYLTTERFMEKPVYTKLISLGAFPDSTTKSVAHNISGITQLVSLHCVIKDSNLWYDVTTTSVPDTLGVSVLLTETAVQTACFYNGSSMSGIAIIKYTK